MVKADMNENLFHEVTRFLREARGEKPAEMVEAPHGYATFPVPATMSFHAKEILAALVHAIDPTIDANDLARRMGGLPKNPHATQLDLSESGAHHDGHLYFNHAYDKLPVEQLLIKLQDLRNELQSSVNAITNDGTVHFTAPNGSRFDLDYVLRAALPYPTPIAFDYRLPERANGQDYRDDQGKTIPGGSIVNHDELMNIYRLATFDSAAANGADPTDILAAKCVRAAIPESHAQHLATRLGLNPDSVALSAA